ncbi:MAG: sigma 54-interacting transcriptional regulator [Thermodesulfobacteriota bacterium]|nr:MAG: sigma 54-interacting transcriptional regulator [Thermodesulfobacteriota bacterium]
MNKSYKTREQLLDELEELRSRVREAEETLRAIVSGEVDGLVVSTAEGDRVFTLSGADLPYRVMVETMNEGAVTLASDGTILFCNQRFADIVKGSLEKVIGSSIYRYISSTDLQLFKALFERGLKGNSKGELTLQTGGDNPASVLLSISALEHTDMPGAVCMVVTDLTEQKRNEEILAEEKLTTQILHQASEIFVLCDPQGLIIRASQSTDRLFGRSPIFQPFDQAFHLIYPDGTPFVLLSAMTDKILQRVEVTFKHGKNEFLAFLLSANLLITHKGVLGIIVVIIDITLRKRAEQALQNAYDEMDLRVKERTEELFSVNQQLLLEIEDRKQAANSLREALRIIEQLKDQLHEENIYLKKEINLIYSHKDIVGNSEAISTVLKQVEQVGLTDSTVLILGETGTGKELIAHAIHNLSDRKDRIIIKVNCAALPPTLIESELFGHEKGAFTGALSKQIGRFELADASTILLDEIDSLPPELQAKLLRVLESGEFERLGSPRTVKVNVRIITASNRDLARLVSEGGFREDLYYRLNIFQITIPPLRERREDILPLVWSFVQEFGKRMGKRIESIRKMDIEALQAYPWPGNVRELRNVTERAMIVTIGPVLHFDVPKITRSAANQSGTLEEVEKRRIIEALNTTKGRVSGKDGAAEILGINPKTLESRMQRLGIQRNKKMPDISGES